MSFYKFNWRYVFLIGMCLLLAMDSMHLLRVKKNLAKQMALTQRPMHPTLVKTFGYNNNPLLLYQSLYNIILLSELNVIAINNLPTKENNLALNLELQGNYLQWMNFFARLQNPSVIIYIPEFSLTADNKNLTILLQLHFYRVYDKPSKRISLTLGHDPFALSNQLINHFSVSVFQLHYTGFMCFQDCYALFGLPEGETMPIKIGEEIGRERAIVKAISSQQVTLLLHNQPIIFKAI